MQILDHPIETVLVALVSAGVLLVILTAFADHLQEVGQVERLRAKVHARRHRARTTSSHGPTKVARDRITSSRDD